MKFKEVEIDMCVFAREFVHNANSSVKCTVLNKCRKYNQIMHTK